MEDAWQHGGCRAQVSLQSREGKVLRISGKYQSTIQVSGRLRESRTLGRINSIFYSRDRGQESEGEKEDGQNLRFKLLSDGCVYLESKNIQADAKRSRVRSSALVTTALLLFFLEGASNFHEKPSPSFTVRKPPISLTGYVLNRSLDGPIR